MKMTKMSRAIMPGMTNQRGILFGGQMMAWMDVSNGESEKVAEGLFVYVALDEHGKPRKVGKTL